MLPSQKIAPCLWFDDQAEQAAELYTSIFDNSRIVEIARYTDAGQDITGGKPGSVMTVAFELEGQSFTALNGGPLFQFNEAISLQVYCQTQDEVDYYWTKLIDGGGAPSACGWLKDRFGLSWQVTPTPLLEWITDKDIEKVKRVTNAMLKMQKLDLDELRRAYEA
jgi:predicted 3-demethylubiquinone-9 3-methyltransferase (glyoxalase superfamily)